ncbi:hypothetical protein LS73_003180 [Helicobacter muridarum]|uniref:Phosphatidylserine decarboxylase n=1 Tax=Helicobacter muridarum TaxID=216 RepID=A0A099TYY4_9HELI|nr:hypothetical protein [Helicobacter muridarum]TLE00917.1 hypothetical protein LS73_003180 [Helicobacter muridarum]STQ86693.1 Uncharacterised protein [Helicobacter muridarum]
MRIIEPEHRFGTLLLIIVVLVFLYFNWYILSGITALLVFFWIFSFGSKIIVPTNPQGIVAPINGRVVWLMQDNDSITIEIKTRWNARIYAPTDLNDVSITYIKGFYFIGNSRTANELGARDRLEANVLLDNDDCKLTIHMLPRFFRFCSLRCDSDKSLFLDKIGFLNIGRIRVKLTGSNLQALVGKGDSIKAGLTTIITKQRKS